MRGGGVHGAYEVGALKAIVANLEPFEYEYDIVSGVSVGALNSAILALYPKGQEQKGVEELEKLYLEKPFTELWDFWPWRWISPFYKPSFVDITKFRQELDDRLKGRPY